VFEDGSDCFRAALQGWHNPYWNGLCFGGFGWLLEWVF